MSDEEVILVGQDWTGMHSHRDGEFTSEEIQKYYDIALDMKLNEANDYPDGLGSEINQDWIQEIWDRINPGVRLLSHSIKTNEKCDIKVNSSSSNEYTTIVYLNPDMTPDEGGT